MIRDQIQRPDPLRTIKKLIQERYLDARAVFWAGSVSQNQGTRASDLDLVIIFDAIPNAYREAFIYDEWPIDAFIHDTDTLSYFFEESRAGNGISGTITMILNGQEVTEPSSFSEKIKSKAQKILKVGPATWDKKRIDKERFLITDTLEDIKYSVEGSERIASAAYLLEALGQFYFRSQNKWCASGKSIIRYLKNDNPDLAVEFTGAFESLFKTGNCAKLETLVNKILAPYGGLLWDGFTSHAPKEFRNIEFDVLSKQIQQLEQTLLDPFVRRSPEQLNRLIADEFLEFGGSGKVYNKQNLLDLLPSEGTRKLAFTDFKIKELSKDVMLATYKTTENDALFLRSSIWKRSGDKWQMTFHQGTRVQETEDEKRK